MDLQEIHLRFLSLINKSQGAYYPPEQIDQWLDMGQMEIFNQYYLQFAKSQRIADALAPFKKKYVFTNITTPGGVVTVPSDYFDAIRMSMVVQDASDDTTKTRPCPRLNDDELSARINSQIKPPSLMWPVAEIIENWNLQLYPKQPMAGELSYLSRPTAPHFVYTTIGGVITYNQLASAQMEWADKNILEIINAAVDFSGINTREQDVSQWAEQREAADVTSPVKS